MGWAARNSPDTGLRRQPREHLLRRQTRHGMLPIRRDLVERSEDEPAAGHPWMGKDRVPPVSLEAPEIQDVHVDLPRPVAKGRDAAAAPFDFSYGLEERP